MAIDQLLLVESYSATHKRPWIGRQNRLEFSDHSHYNKFSSLIDRPTPIGARALTTVELAMKPIDIPRKSSELSMSQSVRIALSQYQTLCRQLNEDFPDLDDETLADTLEGLTDLHEIIAEVIRSALVDEAMASGLKARLSDMKARLERLEAGPKEKSPGARGHDRGRDQETQPARLHRVRAEGASWRRDCL